MDTKSSRKSRDERDRAEESTKEHRDGEHRHHRSSSKHKSRDAKDDDEKVRSKHHERSHEREGSRDRSREDRGHDRDRREREGSRDRVLVAEESRHSKRKERGYVGEDGTDKRARVSDERKVGRRFDVDKESNGGEKRGMDGRRERKRFDDTTADVNSKAEKRERRKFGDRVKKEGMDVDEEGDKQGGVVVDERKVKSEPKDEMFDYDQVDAADAPNGTVVASRKLPETSLAPGHSTPTKVYSISTTNENKGVNITGSHEVPGKSSTDGTSSAGKSGNFSIDALAKAKKVLQMKKELEEKMKKLPLSNKGVSSGGIPQVGSKEGLKAPSSSSGLLPTPVIASTLPSAAAAASANPTASILPPEAGLTVPNVEAVKRAQELAAKMGFWQDPQFAPLINMFPGQMPPEVTFQPKPAKAPVLRLDAQGREVDEHGNVVNTTKVTNLSTLKVNINKQKKEAFQILKPELDVDPEKNPHFDPRMGIDSKKLLRPKRSSFQFVEEGKWSKDAEIVKLKSQFGEAQAKELKLKQAQLAKAKAEPDINPNLIEVSERVIIKEKPKEQIPDIEWWDQPLLHSSAYGDITEGIIAEDKLRTEKITIYVEHPRPIEPPAEPAPPPPQPLKLTKKEQKKLRTQRRLVREKDRQEMIRQGLLEPPKPKVKMSNLMKVLGSEATQDPTRLEMEIRSAAAEREQAHIDRNIARKLTPDERREKKERKLFDDPNTAETIVSVYKVNSLSHPQTRFKVDVNAQENRLTGCAVIADGISVVLVEGGMKSIKRYGKLMLNRIDWASAVKKEDEEGNEDEDKPVNKCLLVWQGSVAKPSFHRFSVHECRTEAAARKVFSDAGVGHYWDLSVNFTEDQM
ncbi:protein RDM16 isoform X1 [Rhododendron vialii]|uniref:protein RDM16 isoform X1 n=3 Tax=Rhododendron vialii TaxID=182163 RepID=UPI00265EFD72|nr:protein RDM16 isoform X1 [Rhododendron vialii]